MIKAFLLDFVRIDERWLAEAIALHARNNGALNIEIAQFAAAVQLDEYLKVLNSKVAPRSVLDGDFKTLLHLYADYKSQIENMERTGKSWAIQSSLFLRYAELYSGIDDLKEKLRSVTEGDAEDHYMIVEDMQDFVDRAYKLGKDLSICQDNIEQQLSFDVAAEMGDWLRLRTSEIEACINTIHPEPAAHLAFPARDESLRAAIDQFTLKFVESF
jgi:hypothetical protein